MAAWTARIDGITDPGGAEVLTVSVTYFDATDTGLTNPLWTTQLPAGDTKSQADLRADIIAAGQAKRAHLARLQNAQSLVGSSINVP